MGWFLGQWIKTNQTVCTPNISTKVYKISLKLEYSYNYHTVSIGNKEQLEGMACYAGQLLALAEGFDLLKKISKHLLKKLKKVTHKKSKK